MPKENGRRYFGRDLEAMSFAINYHSWILDEIRPYIGRSVLEVGAGSGNFSEMIWTTGPESHIAVEPSENMYPLLEGRFRNRSNAHALKGFMCDLVENLPAQPDTAIYINVLEHIREDEKELRIVYDVLKPGGHLCIFVPALQWLYGTADANVGHERRYDMSGLRDLVSRVGYRIEMAKYFDIAGIVPWWILFVLLKREAVLAGQVSIYDRLVIPVMRRIESLVTPPIGKNILLIATKPL